MHHNIIVNPPKGGSLQDIMVFGILHHKQACVIECALAHGPTNLQSMLSVEKDSYFY